MRKLLMRAVLITGLMFTAMLVLAAPAVDTMSDMEVREYAIKFSDVIDMIQQQKLCQQADIQCLRAEYERNGISYDDKVAVQKRLVIMVGSIY